MCTALSFISDDHYFGRTLDYEFSYGESVVVLPRSFELHYRHTDLARHHLALIGTAHIEDGYPLFYDAANESGLCMAGLNFVGNAVYATHDDTPHGKLDIAQFELIPWVLSNCDSLHTAKELLGRVRIVDTPFSDKLSASELHWLISDKSGSAVLEVTKDGMHIYDDPVGVLTNNPPFESQMLMLSRYAGLSAADPDVSFGGGLELPLYSRGMGALGLPGDLSSTSRFARAAFTRANTVRSHGEKESVNAFFRILGSVEQTKGCCIVGDKYEYSIYTSCINATHGVYYYKTYDSLGISAVDMHAEYLDGDRLSIYPMRGTYNVDLQNK